MSRRLPPREGMGVSRTVARLRCGRDAPFRLLCVDWALNAARGASESYVGALKGEARADAGLQEGVRETGRERICGLPARAMRRR